MNPSYQEHTMKFLTMHKHDPKTEAGVMPPMELITAMGALVGGMAQTGQLIDGDGLGKSANRSRLSFKNGERIVTHGPFAGSDNELPASISKVTVKSRDEAIEHATNVARRIGGDVELEVSRCTEGWDMGMMEKPVDAPERYLIIQKATSSTEAGVAPTVPEGSVVLTPSRFGKRMTWRAGKHSVVDGPFAESKEMIGGYAILEMASMEECVAFCKTYADILLMGTDTLELDIRPLA
jgi:hypothetical protein